MKQISIKRQARGFRVWNLLWRNQLRVSRASRSRRRLAEPNGQTLIAPPGESQMRELGFSKGVTGRENQRTKLCERGTKSFKGDRCVGDFSVGQRLRATGSPKPVLVQWALSPALETRPRRKLGRRRRRRRAKPKLGKVKMGRKM